MTEQNTCWFTFVVMENDERDEPTAPIRFTIELDEKPDVMLLTMSETGYYQGQIKWIVTSYRDDLSAPYEIEIDIHGNVNPSYNAALVALFGEEVGATLLMESEAYRTARQANFDRHDTVDEKYLGSLTIVKALVDEMCSQELAKQVLGRLLTNSIFV